MPSHTPAERLKNAMAATSNSPPEAVTNHQNLTAEFSPSPQEQEAAIDRPDGFSVAGEIPFIRVEGSENED